MCWQALRGKKLMRQVVRPLAGIFLLFTICALAAENPTGQSAKIAIIPVSQIHTGMRGVAYTVFQGVKPEPMDVEVLGIMKNMNGPKGDIILVRLHGEKAEYTGVVAGMSGSPVYFDGKLAGALAFRIGEFSKEPIAGVTPIADMLEINAFDKSPGGSSNMTRASMPTTLSKTSGPGESSSLPAAECGELPEADRNASGVQRLQRRNRPAIRTAVCSQRNCAGHGRWFFQRSEAARAPGSGFSGECRSGPWRHGYRGHLHGDLYRFRSACWHAAIP